MESNGFVYGPVRAILRLEGLFILAAAIGTYYWLHASWLLFVVLILAPDIAILGYLRDTRVGAWTYNAFHTAVGPFALAAIALFVARELLPFAIIWGAHIAMDRTFGFGLKYDDAFAHTHLGMIGKER